MVLFHLVLVLFTLLLNTVMAFGSYSKEVKEFLWKLTKGELDYKCFWFFELVGIEEELPEASQKTIRWLDRLAKESINAEIRVLIDRHYRRLLMNRSYHYQIIRALDQHIGDELAVSMILNYWLEDHGASIEQALKSLKSAGCFHSSEKTAALAIEKLEKRGYMLKRYPHPNIWYYLTYCAIKGLNDQHPIDPVLLGPVLSHQTSISKILAYAGDYPAEWLIWQIKQGIFNSDNASEALKRHIKTQKELTKEELWTRTSLEMLKKENPTQLLNEELPLPKDIVTGTVSKFFRLFVLMNAEEIVKSIPISSIEHMYFVFIFGINIGPDFPRLALGAAHYKRRKLTKLAERIKKVWRDKNIMPRDKNLWIEYQILAPYLNVRKLFKKGQLDEEYARKVANKDLDTLELIDFAIDQQNELSNKNPTLYTPKEMYWTLADKIPRFCFEDCATWKGAAIKHFRHLISIFITSMINVGGNEKHKEMLEEYLGYTYDEKTEPPFSKLSIDVLRNQYKLYTGAYDELFSQVSKGSPTISKDGNQKDCSTDTSGFRIDTLSENQILDLKNKLADFKFELCRRASYTNHSNLNSDYCKRDLKGSLIFKLGYNLYNTEPEFLKFPLEFYESGLSFELTGILNEFFWIPIPVLSMYASFIFKLDYDPILIHRTRMTPSEFISTKFYKLVKCKADPFWELISNEYLTLITRKGPLEVHLVNKFMEKLSSTIRDFIKEPEVLEVALAISHALNLTRLTKEQLKDVLRDALLDGLELPVAFLWHLLNVHFKKNIFKWNVFDSKLKSLDRNLSSIKGMNTLKEIKSIIGFKPQESFLEQYRHYVQKYQSYYEKKNYQELEKNFDMLLYARSLCRFKKELKACRELMIRLDGYVCETLEDFFRMFSRAILFDQSSLSKQSTESLVNIVKDLLRKKELVNAPSTTVFNDFFKDISEKSTDKQPSNTSKDSMESISQKLDELNIKDSDNNNIKPCINHSNEFPLQSSSMLLHYLMESFIEQFKHRVVKLEKLYKKLN